MGYVVRGYQPGDEGRHLELEAEVVGDWVWPFAHDAESLEHLTTRPGFDPELHLYAFEGDEMVGSTNVWQVETDVDNTKTAFVLFPKVLPGHEAARDPLIDRITGALKERGFEKITIRGCTMWPESYEWLEARGFRESPDRPRGYKVYYTYDLTKGELGVPTDWVRPVITDDDRSAAAELARIWYKRPAAWCLDYAKRMEDKGAITRLLVQREDHVTGARIAAPSAQRPSLAAIFYIYAENSRSLRQLLSRVVADCRTRGLEKLLVDLIYEHRHFEPTYRDLGFAKEVEHALYEKEIG